MLAIFQDKGQCGTGKILILVLSISIYSVICFIMNVTYFLTIKQSDLLCWGPKIGIKKKISEIVSFFQVMNIKSILTRYV